MSKESLGMLNPSLDTSKETSASSHEIAQSADRDAVGTQQDTSHTRSLDEVVGLLRSAESVVIITHRLMGMPPSRLEAAVLV